MDCLFFSIEFQSYQGIIMAKWVWWKDYKYWNRVYANVLITLGLG